MFALLRTRSLFFRVLLAAGLLAWAGFAFGAPGLQGAAAAQPAHATAPGHCDGMAQMNGVALKHAMPSGPMGQGDCCHGGCHCLSTPGVVLAVPFAGGGVAPGMVPLPVRSAPGVPASTAAPPLRPPIA